jgi:phosphate uptake regulator
MKRKVIKQGHNTLTLTLPNDWVKKLKIEAGNELDVIENSGSLIINGKQNTQEKSTTIDISDMSVPMLWRFFQGAYREGYDEIILKYSRSKKQYESAYNYYLSQFEYKSLGEKPEKKLAIDMIQELVNRFIGIELIDHHGDHCIIREMGEISAKEFDNSLRRIFLLILELFDIVIDAIKNNEVGDSSICKTLHSMDINVDRFIDYCCRINNRINDSTFQKNKPLTFSTLFILELLGDEFKYIGAHLSKTKKPLKEVLPFVEAVKEHFERYYKLFYKFNIGEAKEFGKKDFAIYNEHFNWKESNNKNARSIARHLMQISKFTFCLTELRIEMEF